MYIHYRALQEKKKMSNTTSVQLADAEYDCAACKTIHTYKTSDNYSVHQDYMIGSKRWKYEEVSEEK